MDFVQVDSGRCKCRQSQFDILWQSFMKSCQAPDVLYTKSLVGNDFYGLPVRARVFHDQMRQSSLGASVVADSFTGVL